jgi:hypothetical protein
VIKSVTSLERLFRVDILNRSKTEIEVVIQFINADRNPGEMPMMKRYRVEVSKQTHTFLATLEKEGLENSSYFTK